MPRNLRVHTPGGIYHVILRGNHRQSIFFEARHYDEIGWLIQDGARRFDCRVHAYCWMTNHIHAAVQVAGQPLGKLIQLVAARYARFVQRDIPTTGHLFERRYHAVLVSTDSYLLQLVRYIHLNPVCAAITNDPANYPWSSHRAYLGTANTPWLTTDLVLGLFGPPGDERNAYHRFVAAGCSGEELRALRQPVTRDAQPPSPCRSSNGQATETILRTRTSTLEAIIKEVTESRGVTEDALSSPSRVRHTAQARAEVSRRALREGVATIAELALRFNRSPSSICEIVSGNRRQRR